MRNLIFLTTVFISASALAKPDVLSLYTHIPIELKPVSFDNAYQVAAVCFLGLGCGDDAKFQTVEDNLTIDPKELCKQDGYILTSCSLPSYPALACPHDAALFKECKENRSRACTEGGYVSDCNPGQVLNPDQACPYDNSFQKCQCTPCDGYIYSYAEATISGYVVDGSCMSCSEVKYKRKINDCAGFMECECGGEIGTDECMSGNVKMFAKCKACYVNCPSGTIDVNNYWCGGGAKCYVKSSI